MKKKSIFAALFLLAAGLQTAMAQKMIVTLADDSKVSYSLSDVKEVAFVEEEAIEDEHEWVDLGLPSGTLWATCNVGASKPEEYGDYFAWGETKPKTKYDSSTYFDSDYLKYNDGGLTELAPEDDAATANWGSPWHMPTIAQQDELRENCTREWTQLNGVNGTLVTGPNGNTIFLPAAGCRDVTSLLGAGSSGDYWSRSLRSSDSSCACYLYSYSSYWRLGGEYGYRCSGRSVRPVRVQN